MGNAPSSMKTWALAAYMEMDQRHLVHVRNVALETTDPNSPFLSRKILSHSLKIAGVKKQPDAEIIKDLYTLWDVNGDQTVPLMPFFVGLCPLACQRHDSFRSVLRFTFTLADLRGENEIDPEELFVVLKSLNCTISYLGDTFLRSRHIQKIVMDAVGEIDAANKTQDGGLLHEEVASVIAREPAIKNLFATRSRSPARAVSPPTRKTPKSSSSTVSFSKVAQYRQYDEFSSPGSMMSNSEITGYSTSTPTKGQVPSHSILRERSSYKLSLPTHRESRQDSNSAR